MGKAVAASEEKVARVLCGGCCEKAADKYEYRGVSDCVAASKLAGGQKKCNFGCLGYGTCAKACKFGAIQIVDGIAVIDEEKCTGCGMCKKVCPKNVIELLPKDKLFVACRSTRTGKETVSECSAGCIGCKICEKNCPFAAISVNNNFAKIDYDKCKSCGICAEKCPKKVIKK